MADSDNLYAYHQTPETVAVVEFEGVVRTILGISQGGFRGKDAAFLWAHKPTTENKHPIPHQPFQKTFLSHFESQKTLSA